jgi:hypothetical protein
LWGCVLSLLDHCPAQALVGCGGPSWDETTATGGANIVQNDLNTLRAIGAPVGATTGIDLALAIIRADCGADAALDVARELVVQLRRTGGQSQYALYLAGQFTRGDALTRLIEQVLSQPQLDLFSRAGL